MVVRTHDRTKKALAENTLGSLEIFEVEVEPI
jgi:hypothetical protein